MADLTGAATGVRDVIGRYFSLVSAVPSALLVLWTFLLVSSGAWNKSPDAGRAVTALSGIGVGGAVGLVFAALALGLVLHPVQYGLVQVLEGYWGSSRIGRRAIVLGIRRHKARQAALLVEFGALDCENRICEEGIEYSEGADRIRLVEQQDEISAQQNEISRILARYPDDSFDVMPTRLGNVLRRHERTAGAPWGLDAVTVLPYLSRVAAPGDMDYVNDQRSQLDLAVRMVLVAFVAAGMSVVFLARHGLWLLVALLPYAAGYLAYRGAVVVAAEYGRSLSVLIALNRFALYQRLRLSVPGDLVAERSFNKMQLNPLLDDEDTPSWPLGYDVPSQPENRGYL